MDSSSAYESLPFASIETSLYLFSLHTRLIYFKSESVNMASSCNVLLLCSEVAGLSEGFHEMNTDLLEALSDGSKYHLSGLHALEEVRGYMRQAAEAILMFLGNSLWTGHKCVLHFDAVLPLEISSLRVIRSSHHLLSPPFELGHAVLATTH
jgi:hypothetical protein